MKLKELLEDFLNEDQSYKYDMVTDAVINAWGRLLYLNYLKIPMGTHDNRKYQELTHEIYKYNLMDEDDKENEDEWFGHGCKLNDGEYLLNRKTIDLTLHAAEQPLSKDMVMWRYGAHPGKLEKDSWLSLTSNPDAAYPGDKHEIHIPKGTPIVDTKGLADKGEWIIWTTTLLDVMEQR